MARYNRINLDGKSETRNAIGETDELAGKLVMLNSSGKFIDTTGGASESQLYIINANTLAGQPVDAVIPAGSTLVADIFEGGREFAALVQQSSDLIIDTPLAVASGMLKIATGSDRVVAFSKEIYSVSSSAAELVRVRVA